MSRVINGVNVDDFTLSYLETALWSSRILLPVPEDELVDGCMNVDEDHPLHGIGEYDNLDDHFDFDDLTEESLWLACIDCNIFRKKMKSASLWDKVLEYQDEEHIAHDFCLTRNHHGAGFWDGDYQDNAGQENSVGNQITTLVEWSFREFHIWVTDSGSLEIDS